MNSHFRFKPTPTPPKRDNPPKKVKVKKNLKNLIKNDGQNVSDDVSTSVGDQLDSISTPDDDSWDDMIESGKTRFEELRKKMESKPRSTKRRKKYGGIEAKSRRILLSSEDEMN